MAYTGKRRQEIISAVLKGLRAGTPLTVICSERGMPCDDTIRDWADSDEKLYRDIARAREVGFDQIALDALKIANTPLEGKRIKKGKDGTEIVTEDMLGHRKLQVDTRLKLLAKWDPKRYGDATTIKHADADGEKVKLDEVSALTRLASLVNSIQGRSDESSDDAG